MSHVFDSLEEQSWAGGIRDSTLSPLISLLLLFQCLFEGLLAVFL